MIKATAAKLLHGAIGGMFATLVLIGGCDPYDEPDRMPAVPDTPERQQEMTGPSQTRSQEEYAEQLGDSLTDIANIL